MPQEIPFSTFCGYLRCHRPETLNDCGRQVLKNVFPGFGNPAIEGMLDRLRAHRKLGVITPGDAETLSQAEQLLAAGVPVESRRHRRYAGGDGTLPRGCYYSVCKDEFGDDEGTLCRELFEYRAKNVPGTVFVGDSNDREFFGKVTPGTQFKPGASAVCVVALPPSAPEDKKIWLEVYRETLRLIHGEVIPAPFATIIETNQEYCEIEDVIDLRLPATQAWLHEQFTREALPYYVKHTASRPRFFVGMLPTLMHFEYGGSALTHGIGCWLRAHGAQGLIFPSARSDASVVSGNGAIAEFHGWNFVDYRSAQSIPPMEAIVDTSPWDEFEPSRGVSLQVKGLDESFTCWGVRGVENFYTALREQIITLF